MRFHTFVSYAHLDNVPLAGAENGWVSTLVDGLKNELGKHLGRTTIWWDEKLSGNDSLTPTILYALEQSATLLVILSPGYLNSEWCRRERNTFLQIAANRFYEEERIFIVEPLPVDISEKPEQFRDLIGYKFWIQDKEGKAPRTLAYPKPDPSDGLYYDKLNDLAYDLAKKIKQIGQVILTEEPIPIHRQREDASAVFLAEVTDDLDDERDEVKRYLDQAGISILPEKSLYSHYISEAGGLFSQLEQQIARSRYFVQLLSHHPGKRQPGQSSFPRLQYDAAVKLGKPILQWRAPGPLANTPIVDDQRALLEGNTVHAVNLEEFKQEVLKLSLIPEEKPIIKPEMAKNLVFLDFEKTDSTLAADVKRFIEDQGGFDLVEPLQYEESENSKKITSEDIRQDLDVCLKNSSGVIIVYGEAPPTWARAHLLQCRKSISQREHEFKALAVFNGPPEKKTDLGITLSKKLVSLDARKGHWEDQLRQFLKTLSAEDAS